MTEVSAASTPGDSRLDALQEASKHPPARLRWLHIHEYEELSNTRLEFSESINVVLGLNGTGKTTLLELLVRVCSWDFRSWAQREFCVEFCFENGIGRWWCRVQNRVRIEQGQSVSDPTVRLEITGYGDAITVTIDSKTLVGASGGERVETGSSLPLLPRFLLPFRAGMSPQEIALSSRLQIALLPLKTWTIAPFFRLDEGLDFFNALVDPSISANARLQFDPATPGSVGIEGRELLLHWDLKAETIVAHPFEEVVVPGASLGASAEYLAALGFAEVFASFGRPEIQKTAKHTNITLGPLSIYARRSNGDVLRHSSMSWGQRRLLSFVIYLKNSGQFVVADELVNGMHHAWIELCLRAVEGRQVFLTSQNPLLVDRIELESPEQIARSFLLCSTEESAASGLRRVWRNMTINEAQKLFDARSVGFQSTSELMRFEGWW